VLDVLLACLDLTLKLADGGLELFILLLNCDQLNARTDQHLVHLLERLDQRFRRVFEVMNYHKGKKLGALVTLLKLRDLGLLLLYEVVDRLLADVLHDLSADNAAVVGLYLGLIFNGARFFFDGLGNF
jgi:hypothetical protein